MGTSHTYFKYFLIVILAIGLYLTWLEKEQIAQKTKDLKYQFIFFKDNVKQELEQTKEKYKELLEQNKQLQKQIEEKKEIQLLLPEPNKDYSKLIKKESDIVDDINLSFEEDKEENDVVIKPEVFINKDEKTLEGGKVSIETKF